MFFPPLRTLIVKRTRQGNRSAVSHYWSNIPLPPQKSQQLVAFVANALANSEAGDFATEPRIPKHIGFDAKKSCRLGLAVGQLVPDSLPFIAQPFQRGSDDGFDERSQIGFAKRDIHQIRRNKKRTKKR